MSVICRLISVLGMNTFLVRGQGRGAAPAATLMRTYIPPELVPCLDYELLAASGQYVEVDTTFSQLKIPGIFPNVDTIFKRTHKVITNRLSY
jgi:hypothetical protein